MHPGPINVGMEIDESIAESEQSLILEQVENGLYVRTALLDLIT